MKWLKTLKIHFLLAGEPVAGPDAPRLKLVRAGGVLKVPEASDSLCDPSERDGEGPLEGVEPEPPEAEEAAPFEPPEPFEPFEPLEPLEPVEPLPP